MSTEEQLAEVIRLLEELSKKLDYMNSYLDQISNR